MATDGLCECGCGQPAPIATMTWKARGWLKGQPMRFVRGHSFRGKKHSKEARAAMSSAGKGKRRGPDNPRWNNGRCQLADGYIRICLTDGSHILEHRLVMQRYIGRLLTTEEVVHHINGVKDDNRIQNLQLFATTGEHTAYHRKLLSRH